MKTGHTDSAGYCLVSTAMRGDRRILVVVVGTDSEATRAEESLKLLNWSFQNFDTVKLFDKSQPGIDARVWEGTVETVKLGPPNPVSIAVPRGTAGELKPVAQRNDPLIAPLAKASRSAPCNSRWTAGAAHRTAGGAGRGRARGLLRPHGRYRQALVQLGPPRSAFGASPQGRHDGPAAGSVWPRLWGGGGWRGRVPRTLLSVLGCGCVVS